MKTEMKNWEIVGLGKKSMEIGGEEFTVLRQMIAKQSSDRPSMEKLEHESFALQLKMYDYSRQGREGKMIEVGYFLKAFLELYQIKSKDFAAFIGLGKTNLSALLNGKRKLNYDLALILQNIFGLKADIWLQIQLKNDLWKIEGINKNFYKKYSLEELKNEIRKG